MANRRLHSLAQIVMINCAALGFEVSASVAFTYVPPLLLKYGFGEASMTVIMGLGPCLALFTVPWLGRWADNCQSPLGRRRPFILGFFLLLLLALLIIPNVHGITQCLGLSSSHPVNFVVMAFGVILMDYATQATWNPCQSIVSDFVHQDRTLPGFTVYSAMLSFGSCLGYVLIAIDWEELGFVGSEQVKVAFVIAAFILVIGVGLTICFAGEKPLKIKPFSNDVESKLIRNGNAVNGEIKLQSDSSKCWRILVKPAKVFCLPCHMYVELSSAPRILKKLFVTDLMAWIAVNCYLLFFTDFVGQVVYKGVPGNHGATTEFRLYDEGVRMGCKGLLGHSIIACLYSAFIQQNVTKRYGLKFTYISGLIVFTCSLMVMLVTHNVTVIMIMAGISGLGFAVVTTVPNSLLNAYNANQRNLYFSDEKASHTPSMRGLGQDLAVSDSAYYLSQIILSCFVGGLVEYTGYVQCYIAVATIAGFFASFLALRVVYIS